MSYWRREHQLPGLYCCTKHGLPLGYVETPNAFLLPPSTFYGSHHAVDLRWVEKLKRSDTVQQSDLVNERFDAAWLASVVPGLADKRVGEFWSSVDGALSGKRMGISSIIYAIVFASLFESSDEATNAMMAPSPPDSVKARGCRTVVEVTDQQLRDTYVECRGCHSAVARQLGGARRRLQEEGLPNLGSSASPSIRNAAAAVFIEGVSIDQASKAHGIDRSGP